PQTTQ
ncbi:peptidase M16 inactive domain protein, partial [Chlamydia psittaci 02DC14]